MGISLIGKIKKGQLKKKQAEIKRKKRRNLGQVGNWGGGEGTAQDRTRGNA